MFGYVCAFVSACVCVCVYGFADVVEHVCVDVADCALVNVCGYVFVCVFGYVCM